MGFGSPESGLVGTGILNHLALLMERASISREQLYG